MKTSIRIALGLVLAAVVCTRGAAQEKIVTTISILVPERGEKETVVKVNGEKLDGEGQHRTYKVALEKGKSYKFVVDALIIPNNYTEIKRKKEFSLEGGKNVNVKLD